MTEVTQPNQEHHPYAGPFHNVDVAHEAALASNEQRSLAANYRADADEAVTDAAEVQEQLDHVSKLRFDSVVGKLQEGEIDQNEAFSLMRDVFAKHEDDWNFHVSSNELPEDDPIRKELGFRPGSGAVGKSSPKSILKDAQSLRDWAEAADHRANVKEYEVAAKIGKTLVDR